MLSPIIEIKDSSRLLRKQSQIPTNCEAISSDLGLFRSKLPYLQIFFLHQILGQSQDLPFRFPGAIEVRYMWYPDVTLLNLPSDQDQYT